MKKQIKFSKVPSKALAIAVAITTLGVAGPAMAFKINTGSPDATLVFDNTVRYTAGVRTDSPDMSTAASPNGNASGIQGASRFGKGDLVVNRLDWLGELDFAWKRTSGVRISAAAWYDLAQDECAVKNNNGGSTTTNFSTGSYCDSDKFNYYVKGPGIDLLDAFAYTAYDFGEVQTTVRAGKHVTYWGEAMFETDNNINFNNGPMDKGKAAANPGIEAKETFMPWNQVSAGAQIGDKLSLNAFYNIKWAATRNPEAGSWFQAADGFFTAPDKFSGLPRLNDVAGENGSWGISARWRPDFLESGAMGFYYRNFTMTDPTFRIGGSGMQQYYSKNVELYGWSMNKVFGRASVGAEVSYRLNSNLNNPNGRINGTTLNTARGTTFHALVNAMQGLTPTALYDTGTVIAELSYQHLIEVTENANLYKGTAATAGGYSALCTGVNQDIAIKNGCGTRDWLGFSLSVTPQWLGAISGMNLSMPMFFGTGIKGIQSTGGGIAEARYRYSIGVEAEFLNTPNPLKVRLQYADQYQGPWSTQGAHQYNDRGWVSLNAKMSF